jgi:hypothetical protein
MLLDSYTSNKRRQKSAETLFLAREFAKPVNWKR